MNWLKRFKRVPLQDVMGHRIAEPRLTLMALVWLVLVLGVPLVGLGMLIDAVIQLTTGRCVGIWCWF